MLSELRQKIEDSTHARKCPDRGKIFRNFSFVVSPSLSRFHEVYRERFPVLEGDPAILSPWITFSESREDCERKVWEAVGNSFDANLITRVRAEGVSFWDSVNQVLVIADLGDPEACDRILEGCRLFREAVQRINPVIPLYFVGVFFLRRSTNWKAAGGKEFGKKYKEGVLQSGFFERVFMLDIANGGGARLSEEDQVCLAGHLIYFLTTYPLLVESPGEYLDWLKQGSPQEEIISGFSAFSLVLPVDQILEAVAVATGSEIMEESLLADPPLNCYRLYLEEFLQKHFLLNTDEVAKNISADGRLSVRDPLVTLPEISVLGPENYLETMGALDASLPGVAKENGELMREIGKKRVPGIKASLDSYLEAMITQEKGGLIIAKAFLEELCKHFTAISPGEVPEAKYIDPGGLIQTIRVRLDRGPRKESLYARGAVLGLVAGVAAVSLPISAIYRALLAVGTASMSMGLAVFASHAANYKLQTSVICLESALREKWQRLMEPQKAHAAKVYLGNLRSDVEQASHEINSAIARLGELVEYFRERYSPAMPAELALWKYVFGNRNELLEMKDLCRSDVSLVARDYLEKDRPLFLWQRLSRPGAGEPGKWEWNILEKASLRVLPDCGEIVSLHVLSVLDGNRPRFNRLQNTMLGGADPFLCLNPGSEVPRRNAILEAGADSNHPVTRELERSIGKMFKVDRVNESSSYRLTVFGFLEGVQFDSVQRGVST